MKDVKAHSTKSKYNKHALKELREKFSFLTDEQFDKVLNSKSFIDLPVEILEAYQHLLSDNKEYE